jgi:ParB-like chromosome segregation protein Spo0J
MRYDCSLKSSKPKICWLPIDKLIALRRNPQWLTERQMTALKESITRDGFLVPIIVRPKKKLYEILAGNHRVTASRELGIPELPCVVIRCDDKTAARIAVNTNTVHGDPSAELLAPFLAPLDDLTLSEIYIDGRLLSDLKDFDKTLKERLDAMQLPSAFDRDSPTSPLPTCVCPTCQHRHVPAEKRSRSSRSPAASTAA